MSLIIGVTASQYKTLAPAEFVSAGPVRKNATRQYAATAPGNGNYTYTWTFPNNVTRTGQVVYHTMRDTGPQPVQLRIEGEGQTFVGEASYNMAADPRDALIAAAGGSTNLTVYDPADWETLFQDTSRTTPVTGRGENVFAMDDVASNARPASTNTQFPPELRFLDGKSYLYFDGFSDRLTHYQAMSADFLAGIAFRQTSNQNGNVLWQLTQNVRFFRFNSLSPGSSRVINTFLASNVNLSTDAHISTACNGSTGFAYVDGAFSASGSINSNYASGTSGTIGAYTGGNSIACTQMRCYGAAFMYNGNSIQFRSELNDFLDSRRDE